MADVSQSSSITHSVYGRLRADLLACRLVPGQKLKIEEICQRLSVGSSAVREALSRLASEGLVLVEPQRGFRVMPLDLDDLRDLTRARCEIEAICIRDAIAQGGIEWETALIASLHRLSRTPVQADGDPKRYGEAYAAAHSVFHEALVGACASRWLMDMRRLLSMHQERYRWLSRPLAKTERDLDQEHSAIAQAALGRDPETAVALLTDHIRQTARIVLEASVASPSPSSRNRSRSPPPEAESPAVGGKARGRQVVTPSRRGRAAGVGRQPGEAPARRA